MTLISRLGLVFGLPAAAAVIFMDSVSLPVDSFTRRVGSALPDVGLAHPVLLVGGLIVVVGVAISVHRPSQQTQTRSGQRTPRETTASASASSSSTSDAASTDSQFTTPTSASDNVKASSGQSPQQAPANLATSTDTPNDTPHVTRQKLNQTVSTTTSSTRVRRQLSTFRNRQEYRPRQQRANTSSENRKYFAPFNRSRPLQWGSVDTQFNILDVRGVTGYSLDPVPDLIEVKVGPSGVSHELVRSPLEIRISSVIKTLLRTQTPPRQTGTAPVENNTRSERRHRTRTGKRAEPQEYPGRHDTQPFPDNRFNRQDMGTSQQWNSVEDSTWDRESVRSRPHQVDQPMWPDDSTARGSSRIKEQPDEVVFGGKSVDPIGGQNQDPVAVADMGEWRGTEELTVSVAELGQDVEMQEKLQFGVDVEQSLPENDLPRCSAPESELPGLNRADQLSGGDVAVPVDEVRESEWNPSEQLSERVGNFWDSPFQDEDAFSPFQDAGSGVGFGKDTVMGDPQEVEAAMDELEERCGFGTEVELESAFDNCDEWGFEESDADNILHF